MPLPVAHFWSLAIEEQFYLFWPLGVLLLSRRGLLVASATFFVLAFAVRMSMVHADNLFGAYRFTLCRLDSLALGGVVAVMMTAPSDRTLLRSGSWAVLGLSGASLAAIAIWRGKFYADDDEVVTYGISFLALFFARRAISTRQPFRRSIGQGPRVNRCSPQASAASALLRHVCRPPAARGGNNAPQRNALYAAFFRIASSFSICVHHPLLRLHTAHRHALVSFDGEAVFASKILLRVPPLDRRHTIFHPLKCKDKGRRAFLQKCDAVRRQRPHFATLASETMILRC